MTLSQHRPLDSEHTEVSCSQYLQFLLLYPRVKVNRLFCTKSLVGQQKELEHYSNFTDNQSRQCSSGTLQVNGDDFVTTQTK